MTVRHFASDDTNIHFSWINIKKKSWFLTLQLLIKARNNTFYVLGDDPFNISSSFIFSKSVTMSWSAHMVAVITQ